MNKTTAENITSYLEGVSNKTNKTYGIMFTAENILAYLELRKTQTRRLKGLKEINQAPDKWELIFQSPTAKFVTFAKAGWSPDKKETFRHINLPYGQVGNTLWFKETYKMWERDTDGQDFINYRADDGKLIPDWWVDDEWRKINSSHFKNWHSSMLMPKVFSRFRDVPILSVRCERLHAITEADAQAEGVVTPPPKGFIHSASYREEYMKLWDRINAKTMPSNKNSWVFVYEFPKYPETYIKEEYQNE